MRLVPFGGALAALAFVAALGGCAHLTYNNTPGTGTPTPSPTGSSGPTAVPCNSTPTTGAQIVAIWPQIAATSVPPYGTIYGYGLITSGQVGTVASVITLLPADVVQFFNNDSLGSTNTYSAVGIPNVSAFPAPSYTFPPAATSPTGTQINSTTSWSTGLLGPQCYSQAFTIAKAGTYFFGDYNYYSLVNLRDVLVASTSAPQAAHRKP